MKQEDKQLLLRDLCGRIPYSVKGSIYDMIVTISSISINGFVSILDYPTATRYEVHEFKPYLFPLSSMTEKQKKEYFDICWNDWVSNKAKDIEETEVLSKGVDYLNEHHFDYRGLIDKKLAIDATNLHVYDK